jgi:hypothetical protein
MCLTIYDMWVTGSLAKASVGLAQYRTPATTWLEYFVLHIPIGLHVSFLRALTAIHTAYTCIIANCYAVYVQLYLCRLALCTIRVYHTTTNNMHTRHFCILTHCFIHCSLHLYTKLQAGWVWAAGVVNVNVALVAYNASTETQVAAAILSVLLSIIGAGVAAVHYKDDSFLVSIVWALLGIWVRSDYRYDLLGKDVGRGFGDAIRYGAFALLLLDSYVMLISRNKQLRA